MGPGGPGPGPREPGGPPGFGPGPGGPPGFGGPTGFGGPPVFGPGPGGPPDFGPGPGGFFGDFGNGLCNLISSCFYVFCCCWLIRDCFGQGPPPAGPFGPRGVPAAPL